MSPPPLDLPPPLPVFRLPASQPPSLPVSQPTSHRPASQPARTSVQVALQHLSAPSSFPPTSEPLLTLPSPDTSRPATSRPVHTAHTAYRVRSRSHSSLSLSLSSRLKCTGPLARTLTFPAGFVHSTQASWVRQPTYAVVVPGSQRQRRSPHRE